MTILTKVTEKYFPVVQFIMPYKVAGLFLSLWMKSLSVTIQMKATEQYFPVVQFIIPYKVAGLFLRLWKKSLSVTIQMKTTRPQLFKRWIALSTG